jgi:ParB family chromosome partitioning protein
MAKKKVLGRGIEALIPDSGAPRSTARKGSAGLSEVSLDEIVANPFQPRQDFPAEELSELSASIAEKGIIDPMRVRRHRNSYQLVYGERRLRAAKAAGLKKAPVIVSDYSDQEMLEIGLLENIQRQNLNPLEEATGYQMMIKRGASQEQVAKKMGKDRASVANMLRLLRLPTEVKGLLRQGKLGMGHARALLSLPHRQAIISLARQVAKKGLSVRQVERLVAGNLPHGKKAKQPGSEDAELRRIGDRLRQALGTKIAINYRRGKGKLTVHFYSDEDLNRVVELICGNER